MFQSPSNRGSVPNTSWTTQRTRSTSSRFNPLTIGAVFQTWARLYRGRNLYPAFQSPNNRGIVPSLTMKVLVACEYSGMFQSPNNRVLRFKHIKQALSLMAYQLGFQSPRNRGSVPNATSESWKDRNTGEKKFQSPSNRVIVPNHITQENGKKRQIEFQSPSNRVLVPNMAITMSIYSPMNKSFNPLVIGSLFQTP